MDLRLKILTEIAISPILIGANSAQLQGGVKKKFPQIVKKQVFCKNYHRIGCYKGAVC